MFLAEIAFLLSFCRQLHVCNFFLQKWNICVQPKVSNYILSKGDRFRYDEIHHNPLTAFTMVFISASQVLFGNGMDYDEVGKKL